MRRGIGIGLIGAAAACAASAVDVGSIVGRVEQPESVVAVAAVDRSTGRRFSGKLDMITGRFVLDGLPLEADYDCVIDFCGARLEGVNLRVPAGYGAEQPLSDEDIRTIRTKVLAMNKFEDAIEILDIRGHSRYAAVLLNKLRTQPFYGSKPGEVIWRAEIWHFENPEGTWVKVQDELFIILCRERIQRTVFDRKAVTFDPALGGIRLTAERPHADLGGIPPPETKPGVRLRAMNSSRPRGGQP